MGASSSKQAVQRAARKLPTAADAASKATQGARLVDQTQFQPRARHEQDINQPENQPGNQPGNPTKPADITKTEWIHSTLPVLFNWERQYHNIPTMLVAQHIPRTYLTKFWNKQILTSHAKQRLILPIAVRKYVFNVCLFGIFFFFLETNQSTCI